MSPASSLLVVYAAGLALAVGRLAAGRAPGLLRLWLLGSAGVAAVCGGQALLAAALGDGAALGGGWTELAAFCLLAGAALALALRAAPAAVGARALAAARSAATGARVRALVGAAGRHGRRLPARPPRARPARPRAARSARLTAPAGRPRPHAPPLPRRIRPVELHEEHPCPRVPP